MAITAENAEFVKLLIPLRAKGSDWIFTAPEGGVMNQAKLNDAWTDEIKTLQIRARGLYSLKDTFCSQYISSPGATWEWLSEQTGVAISTLKRHYARFERDSGRDRDELDRIRKATSDASRNTAAKGVAQ